MPFDIGWQRHLALMQGMAKDVAVEFDEDWAGGFLGEDGGDHGMRRVAEEDLGTCLESLGGAQQDAPLARCDFLEQQQLGPSLGPGLASAKAGGDDLGIIEDHEVAGAKPFPDAGEAGVMADAGGAFDDKEAGLVALGEGFLGDQLGREKEVKVGDAHGKGRKWGKGADGGLEVREEDGCGGWLGAAPRMG